MTMLLAALGGLASPAPAQERRGEMDLRDAGAMIQRLRETRAVNRTETAAPLKGKCGFALAFQLIDGWSGLSGNENGSLRALVTAPSTQTDRIIGHAHVYYDTTGPYAT